MATSLRSESGLTLIEVLIVLTMIGILSAIIMSRPRRKGMALESESRRIAAILNECFNSAVIGNKVVRLTVDKAKNTISFESAPTGTLMEDPNTPPPENKEEEKKRSQNDFDADKGLFKKPLHLKKEVLIERVIINNLDSPQGYIYCFPQGRIQNAQILLTDPDQIKKTVSVMSLTGKGKVSNGWPKDLPKQ